MRFLLVALLISLSVSAQPPHLERRGVNTQLIVDGSPFLMLSGELHNSSSSSLGYMKPIWPRLAEMKLNTVLTPISWELVEPTEGHFDFTLVDGLLAQARDQHMHMVFLWLAAWKNGTSGYPPVWVKQDTKRFPRAILNNWESDTLSTFGPATRDADAHAFAAVLGHLKQVDAREHTVLMLQVENEVGTLGAPRDHSPAADRAFASAVPGELTKYLAAHRANLDPELLSLLESNGAKTSGTWAEVFGPTSRADEIFMAWNYALYVDTVAAAGKAAYDLPMYVNTWLAGVNNSVPDKPGDYPSGGPQPRVIDIWKAARATLAQPSLDLYAPDLYAADFAGWAARYHRDGNPLFIPETNDAEAGAANIFYAVGEDATLGFSPFAIDSSSLRNKAGGEALAASYATLAEIAPVLLAQQGSGPDPQGAARTHGFLLDKGHPSADFTMGGLGVHVSLDELFGHHSDSGFGLIVMTGPDEFLGSGKGFRVTFTSTAGTKRVGLASVDEGHFVDGRWVPGRRLNGDESGQGSNWRFDQRSLHIEKARLYRYE